MKIDRNRLRAYLKSQVEEIEGFMHQDLACIDSDLLREVVEHAIFNGGKRLRPLLCLLYASACHSGQRAADRAYRFAPCLEYLHAASLLHDDVIDHAQRRRGKESANARWGNHRVILAGDYLHARALFLAGSLGGMACVEEIAQVVQGMVQGEYLQLGNADLHDCSEAAYYRVVEGKTAMLISAACKTGCIIAGATQEQAEAAGRFGRDLGLAFQVADDLLDYLGDGAKMGKEPGNDWREQRMTLPLIYALETADAAERSWLEGQFLLDPQPRADGFAKACNIMQRCNAFARTKERGNDFADRAVFSLEAFPASEARQFLVAIAHYAVHREQ
jgi:octaprenyl-diphosphate synthase